MGGFQGQLVLFFTYTYFDNVYLLLTCVWVGMVMSTAIYLLGQEKVLFLVIVHTNMYLQQQQMGRHSMDLHNDQSQHFLL